MDDATRFGHSLWGSASAPSRLLAAGMTLATVLLVVFATVTLIFAVGMGTCGGDGGLPYSAPASAAGEFCADQATFGRGFWDLFVPVPLLAVLGGGVATIVRRHWMPLGKQ